ncbi:E3 ubiquitin-protein ligase rnf146 [Anoplophora glabripennis]|uniref:E3 ubiquitin-protein ligase rnf146 n=1 Tax=Anoplophora glabripennis TaxID=217634 RepID=UPI00087397BE|nr:E3 ubiquitin-protein ligase rnf146 [Anoplophora glabripennis]
MAEAVNSESSNNDDLKEKCDSPECAVCLQPCVHPAQLPCGHIFCFLCVKGFANQNKKCAMCRQEIPRDFIDQPNLLQLPVSLDNAQGFDGGYQWFYEGRNGWWQYDERTSKELEYSYKNGEKTCELLIAGFLYIVDLENMLQLRRNDPSRRRRIKRDHANIPKKGIAGLRTDEERSILDTYEERPLSPIDGRTDNVVPITPSNTPQSPTSGRESPDQEQDLQATVERISSLRLDTNPNLNETSNILSGIVTESHHSRRRRKQLTKNDYISVLCSPN